MKSLTLHKRTNLLRKVHNQAVKGVEGTAEWQATNRCLLWSWKAIVIVTLCYRLKLNFNSSGMLCTPKIVHPTAGAEMPFQSWATIRALGRLGYRQGAPCFMTLDKSSLRSNRRWSVGMLRTLNRRRVVTRRQLQAEECISISLLRIRQRRVIHWRTNNFTGEPWQVDQLLASIEEQKRVKEQLAWYQIRWSQPWSDPVYHKD